MSDELPQNDLYFIQMYYLVNGYRFITQKYVFSKTSKKHILKVASQNYAKISFKTFPTYFMQYFRNRPYLKLKRILAYFYIIKAI